MLVKIAIGMYLIAAGLNGLYDLGYMLGKFITLYLQGFHYTNDVIVELGKEYKQSYQIFIVRQAMMRPALSYNKNIYIEKLIVDSRKQFLTKLNLDSLQIFRVLKGYRRIQYKMEGMKG